MPRRMLPITSELSTTWAFSVTPSVYKNKKKKKEREGYITPIRTKPTCMLDVVLYIFKNRSLRIMPLNNFKVKKLTGLDIKHVLLIADVQSPNIKKNFLIIQF